MFIVNNQITFKYTINKLFEGEVAPSYLDVHILSPSGTALYYENTGTYVKPTTTKAGSFTFYNTPSAPGVWTISILNGTSTNGQVHSLRKVNVVEESDEYNGSFSIKE